MTTESQPLSYEQLSELLQPLGILINPSELQGLLCGKFCGGAHPDETDWLLEAVEELDFVQAPDETVRAALVQLYRDTRQQLAQQGFSLQPLLPSDDREITLRVTCLGQWCHGFLVGFGSAGHAGDSDLSDEAREALEDFAAIAQVDLDEEESARAAENDYAELVEYVRMAALSLFMEFGSSKLTDAAPKAGDEPPTLH
ncbi:UPF0149 family protein [Marinimicrobium agarilyticum]|uniref:UPF0149 family protein n=1 Tax=Marinimicrobium agarilyticum TaxID=306546 RepID=UPI000417D061|nr:UPF0149 family protein [Marinimicrobium agarilyticum]